MEKVLLYYPSMNLPNLNWVKNSLLYTDKISTILPYSEKKYKDGKYDFLINDDFKLLFDENVYTPIYAEDQIKSSKFDLAKFEQDFLDRMRTKYYNFRYGSPYGLNLRMMYSDYFNNERVEARLGVGDLSWIVESLTPNIWGHLKGEGLLDDLKYQKMYRIDKIASVLYTSMLAEAFATTSTNLLIPTTDMEIYEKFSYESGLSAKQTYKLLLNNCLPAPKTHVDIKRIIDFREKYKLELFQFRQTLHQVEKDIRNAESEEEQKYILVKFSEQLYIQVELMKRLLGESKIQFFLNSIGSLLDFKQKEIIGTLGTMGVASIGMVSHLPTLGLTGGAIILCGTLVSTYKRSKREINSNCLSYIYHAQKENII